MSGGWRHVRCKPGGRKGTRRRPLHGGAVAQLVMARLSCATASGGHVQRLRRGQRLLGKRRSDAPVQQVTDEGVELDCCEAKVDRDVWEALEMSFVRKILRRTAFVPPQTLHPANSRCGPHWFDLSTSYGSRVERVTPPEGPGRKRYHVGIIVVSQLRL